VFHAERDECSVASLVAAVVSVHAQTPTAADFAACNTEARAAMKAGTLP